MAQTIADIKQALAASSGSDIERQSRAEPGRLGDQFEDLQESSEILKDPELAVQINLLKAKFDEQFNVVDVLTKTETLLEKTITYTSIPVIRWSFSDLQYEFNTSIAEQYANNALYFIKINKEIGKLKEISVQNFNEEAQSIKSQLDQAVGNWSDHWLFLFVG